MLYVILEAEWYSRLNGCYESPWDFDDVFVLLPPKPPSTNYTLKFHTKFPHVLVSLLGWGKKGKKVFKILNGNQKS
jgi:hypothetical protein